MSLVHLPSESALFSAAHIYGFFLRVDYTFDKDSTILLPYECYYAIKM